MCQSIQERSKDNTYHGGTETLRKAGSGDLVIG
jgi:hypothetical protein